MAERRRASMVVADAFPLWREGIAALCERTNEFEVVCHCADGVEALQMIRAHEPDFAVLDLDLPRLHGMSVVRKARGCGLKTRVVMLSTRPDRRLILECLRGGAAGFLLKSDTSARLLEALRAVRDGGVYLSPQLEWRTVFLSRAGRRGRTPLDHLSPRERLVFFLLVEGLRSKEIAARLELSPKTVSTYRCSLMRKLDIQDMAGLVKFAVKRRLVSLA